MNTRFYVIAGIFLVLFSGLAYLFQLDDLAQNPASQPAAYGGQPPAIQPAAPVTPSNNEAAVGGLKF